MRCHLKHKSDQVAPVKLHLFLTKKENNYMILHIVKLCMHLDIYLYVYIYIYSCICIHGNGTYIDPLPLHLTTRCVKKGTRGDLIQVVPTNVAVVMQLQPMRSWRWTPRALRPRTRELCLAILQWIGVKKDMETWVSTPNMEVSCRFCIHPILGLLPHVKRLFILLETGLSSLTSFKPNSDRR